MARVGSVFVIGLSWFWVVTSLRKLWKHGLRREFTILLSILAAGALILLTGYSWSRGRATGDMRLWGKTPFFVLYILSGFFLRGHVEALLFYKKFPERRPVRVVRTRRRALGAIFAAFGVGVWIYGVFRPFTGTGSFGVLLGSTAAMVYGSILLSHGLLQRRP